MINKKDVIWLKVPYPSINSKLAVQSHMYICKHTNRSTKEFVKCQTLKPYMLYTNIMHNYVDEKADIARNPFRHDTRIDCDKVFLSSSVTYGLQMRTKIRPDVCDPLFANVIKKVNKDGFRKLPMKSQDILNLNKGVSII